MTTVAWDGTTMAADSLATDSWGLKEVVSNKILVGKDFLLGCAGEHGQIMRWFKALGPDVSASYLLNAGYANYDSRGNDPSLVLVCHEGVFRHAGGVFMPISRQFHAVGSGRDYALMAMRLGKTAREAIELVKEFDNGTGGSIVEHTLSSIGTAKEDDEGWIQWFGGECPVTPFTIVVQVKRLSGEIEVQPAYRYNWGNIGSPADIVAYREVQPCEPKPEKKADDSWIAWRGGDCPVAKDATVRIRMRNGKEMILPAKSFFWVHHGRPGDIIAYWEVQA